MAPARPPLVPPADRWVPPAQPWWTDSFMVTFAFHCNIACTFCMVEDVLNVFPGTGLSAFERFLERCRDQGPGNPLEGTRRIIFSGGEVTLSRQLLDYARLARRIPGVEHVRIQTNATRLGDVRLLEALLEAGIDEYFVSVHAPDAALYREIARRDEAFDQIAAGLDAIRRSGAALITNTAVVAQNHHRLRDIVEFVLPFAPRSMEFWSYWPRADEDHQVEHVARVAEVKPHLLDALGACVAAGVPPVVKWFPRCLLGDFARYQDDRQPPALIEDDYWERRPGYACLYEGLCQDAAVCSGLSEPYIHRFGWEQDLLQPRRLGREPVPAGRTLDAALGRSLTEDNGPPARDRTGDAEVVGRWLEGFGLQVGSRLDGWTLTSTLRARDGGMVALCFTRPTDGKGFELRLLPRDEARRCYARSPSFDFVYSRHGGEVAEIAGAIREVLIRVGGGDRGGLSLPA